MKVMNVIFLQLQLQLTEATPIAMTHNPHNPGPPPVLIFNTIAI